MNKVSLTIKRREHHYRLKRVVTLDFSLAWLPLNSIQDNNKHGVSLTLYKGKGDFP